ncbi:MAG: hypothetical protein ACR2H3_12910 [Acidimicrobiales bacterium]
MMRRAIAAAGLAAIALLLQLVAGSTGLVWLPAAQAIETATWGITPSDDQGIPTQSAFRLELRPGATTVAYLVAWNKTDVPIVLEFAATAAEIIDGEAALGGAGVGVSWIHFPQAKITLAGGDRQAVAFEVRAPSTLPGEGAAFAVVAQPSSSAADAPAVLERLAVMAYLSPGDPSTLSLPGLGILPWLAGALLVLVAVGAGRHRVLSRRR